MTAFFLPKISDWGDEMNDIFKDMQAKVGCEYISDLPYYKREVWQETRVLVETKGTTGEETILQELLDKAKEVGNAAGNGAVSADRKSTRLNSSHRL